MSPGEETMRLLDAALADRAVVIGSTPPGGRDLDLLARAPEREAAAAALLAAGFRRRGSSFARFADGTAYGVDLIDAETWLPAAALDELLAQAEPLDGADHLVRPSPPHAILVLARLGRLSPKRRLRLEEALARDPGAHDRAREAAPRWGLAEALARLEERPRPGLRLRPPAVVALSGLDGSGKSSQARALRDALQALGYETRIHWLPFGQDRVVEALSSAARRAIAAAAAVGLLRGARERVARGESFAAAPGAAAPAGRLVHAWAALVAAANGWSQLRGLATRADVVVYDRHALDAIARLRFLYGAAGGFRLQRTLIRTLAPRPLRAFWLDVPAEEAYRRKPEHWDEQALARQRELYAEEHAALGVDRLDGTRPAEELAAEIAASVWEAL